MFGEWGSRFEIIFGGEWPLKGKNHFLKLGPRVTEEEVYSIRFYPQRIRNEVLGLLSASNSSRKCVDLQITDVIPNSMFSSPMFKFSDAGESDLAFAEIFASRQTSWHIREHCKTWKCSNVPTHFVTFLLLTCIHYIIALLFCTPVQELQSYLYIHGNWKTAALDSNAFLTVATYDGRMYAM